MRWGCCCCIGNSCGVGFVDGCFDVCSWFGVCNWCCVYSCWIVGWWLGWWLLWVVWWMSGGGCVVGCGRWEFRCLLVGFFVYGCGVGFDDVFVVNYCDVVCGCDYLWVVWWKYEWGCLFVLYCVY